MLDDGSQQRQVWGADWYPLSQTVGYESLINIRPSVNNRSMIIQDLAVRDDIRQLVQSLLSDVQWP